MRFFKHLFFTQFNKKFKPNRTKVDWISSDENQVDLFEADPLRIEDFSLSIFLDLLKGSKKVNQVSTFKNTPKELPPYFGENNTEIGDTQVVSKINIKKVSVETYLKLYNRLLHEMLNEVKALIIVSNLIIG